MIKMDAESVEEISASLAELRGQALRLLVFFTIVCSYLWLATGWPERSYQASSQAWVAHIVLAFGPVLCLLILRYGYQIASSAFLVVTLVFFFSIVLVEFEMPEIAYLFAVPVAFASVLFGRWYTVATASICIAAISLIGEFSFGLSLTSRPILFPLFIIGTISISCWLSQRNLFISLTWAWRAYEQARSNEEVARQRRGELRRALKALDEASYRLERSNEQLARAKQQAEEAQRLKQQFAQSISHELRTPLNLIISFTRLMAQSPEYYGQPLPQAYVRDLSVVHRNASHLRDLVNDVLDLARIDAAQMSITVAEVDPAQLVREAAETTRSLVESRALEFCVRAPGGLPSIWVDETRIRQVLFNLLNNAVRFTDEGKVVLSVRCADGEILFSVEDTGVGIPEEEQDSVFDEFHRLKDSSRHPRQGAGLGLAISKRFVELHGGRIWVESEVGRGSVFTFSIPVDGDRELSLGAEGHRLAQETPSRSVRRPPTLLAVTASISAATLLTRRLRGVRTVLVHDIDEASRLAPQLLPQAILVDTFSISIPAREVHDLPDRWGIPYELVMSCPLPGEEALRKEFGVSGYLVKPFRRDQLQDAMRQFGAESEKVLVVDDDRDFVRLVKRLLDDPVQRYDVAGAYTGREAIEIMRQWEPDLLLLDLGLPDIDGTEVVATIREDARLKDTLIIIVSGQDSLGMNHGLVGALSVSGQGFSLSTEQTLSWVQSLLGGLDGPVNGS